MSEFNGKVALVTGGARGIGAAICKRLSSGGATVAVTDYNGDAAIALAASLEKDGNRAAGFTLDVTSFSGTEKAIEEIERSLGEIEILVNNAGTSHFRPFEKMSEAEWDEVVAINLKGVFNTCRQMVPKMADRGRGCVVNMASVLSKYGEPNFAHYCASKFGVLGLSQSIAGEYAAQGIRVNCVCPGVVQTPLWGTLTDEALQSSAFKTEEEVHEFINSSIPLKRVQTAEDMAEMVAFLASDKARNITAASFHVDGGMVPR